MARDLTRFINPTSVVTLGGSWAANVIQQLKRSGYRGDIWPVHPTRESIEGIACLPNLGALPSSPDAAFIGVNREQTIELVRQLSDLECGGAICFASGFKESQHADLQQSLLDAAGDMPLLGPNCYGFLNYVDNVCLWPDQHGGQQVAQGVAIIAQSSNISINMSMQRRALPLAYLFTLGNQAQIGVSEMAESMLDNPCVTAVGLYLEGIDDVRRFEAMARRARKVGKPVVVLKVGKTAKARAATISHTASLAGGASASSALLRRLGLVEVDSISEFLETLMLLNGVGSLPGADVVSVSCSGGEASMMADLARDTLIHYRDFTPGQLQSLRDVLGDRVELANPLDYHTYIWGDVPVMTRCFEAVMRSEFDLTVFVLDLPRADRCDTSGHECAIEAIIAARRSTGAKVAVLALMPENLDEATAQRFLDAGVIPLHGMQSGLAAIDASIRAGELAREPDCVKPVLLGTVSADIAGQSFQVLDEGAAKLALAEHGLPVPRLEVLADKSAALAAAGKIGYPLVLKGQGIAHKSEAGAVIMGIKSEPELVAALASLPDCKAGYLLEQMVDDVVAELLVGVTLDETGLCLLTLGAGGVLAELLQDTVHLVLPTNTAEIDSALHSLRLMRLLNGYRGKPAANLPQLTAAIESIAAYAEQNIDSLIELDVNPLLAGATNAIAADALIRLRLNTGA